MLLAGSFLGPWLSSKNSDIMMCVMSYMRRLITTQLSSLRSLHGGWTLGLQPWSKHKTQPWQWKSPQSSRSKKAWQVWSATKCIIIFFYIKGIVHLEFLFQLALQWILTSTAKFYGTWKKMCSARLKHRRRHNWPLSW